MKKLLLTLTVVGALASTVYGQGRVGFASKGFDPSDAITVGAQNQGSAGNAGVTGNGIGGNSYSVQLVWVAGTGLSQAAFDAGPQTLSVACTGVGTGTATAAFFGNTGSTASGGGYFDAGTIPNPAGTGMPAGGYTCQVWAWYNVGFSTYAAAAAASKNVGKSGLFNVVATANPTPFNSTAFTGFQVTSVPEPSSLALAGLGAMAMLLIRRKK